MPHTVISKRQHQRAKSLRSAMTRAEILLWRYLKAHHIDNLGFRRQVPMRNYIADFACHSARLIVELDGETHDFLSRQQSDRIRDAWFKSQGYTVLRFTNDEVLSNLSGVIEVIRKAALAGTCSTPPSLSLPHKGGGNAKITVRRPSPQKPGNVLSKAPSRVCPASGEEGSNSDFQQ